MTEIEAIKWQKQLGEVFKGFHLDIEEKMNISCDMAINALEKQIPKKPKDRYKTNYVWDSAYCPICNCGITARWGYCQCCGQKLDWSDTN